MLSTINKSKTEDGFNLCLIPLIGVPCLTTK